MQQMLHALKKTHTINVMSILLLLETSKSLNRIHHHLAVVNQHAKFKCYDLNFKLKNKLNLTLQKNRPFGSSA